MRAFVVCLSLFVLAAAPAAAQTAPANDHVYSLVGTWNCQTLKGSFGTLTYTRAASGSVAMIDKFMFENGELGEFDETYDADPATSGWTFHTKFVDHPMTEAGKAPAWTGDTWILDGTQTVVPEQNPVTKTTAPPHTVGLRETYVRLSDDIIRRAVQFQRKDGTWTPSSFSTCKRAG